MSDTLTLATCAPNLVLAKTLRADGTFRDYDLARVLDMETVEMPDLDALLGFLLDMQQEPRCCVLRGELIHGPHVRGRRLAYEDAKTGDQPTLRDVPRRWLALDFDTLPRPAWLEADDLFTAGMLALRTLPTAFHAATCIVQGTAGHGIKPGLRLRLWVWLTRPTTGGELRRWLAGCPVDACTFRPVQPIYTAAPVLAEGVADPLPGRMVMLPGAGDVLVPSPEALAEPERTILPVRVQTAEDAGRYILAALRRAVEAVQHAPEGKRHETCMLESRALARFIAADMLSESTLREKMREALANAGKDDPDEAEAIVDWALKNPSAAVIPEGVAP